VLYHRKQCRAEKGWAYDAGLNSCEDVCKETKRRGGKDPLKKKTVRKKGKRGVQEGTVLGHEGGEKGKGRRASNSPTHKRNLGRSFSDGQKMEARNSALETRGRQGGVEGS